MNINTMKVQIKDLKIARKLIEKAYNQLKNVKEFREARATIIQSRFQMAAEYEHMMVGLDRIIFEAEKILIEDIHDGKK